MITKKIKCTHCGGELQMVPTSNITRCGCGKVAYVNDVVTEGTKGVDWIDVSQVLING